jgi:hypothetical protein
MINNSIETLLSPFSLKASKEESLQLEPILKLWLFYKN